MEPYGGIGQIRFASIRAHWRPMRLFGSHRSGTLLSVETCFAVSHFLAQPLLAHCQCGHFEGSRQMYGYLDMPVVELGESSIVWSS